MLSKAMKLEEIITINTEEVQVPSLLAFQPEEIAETGRNRGKRKMGHMWLPGSRVRIVF